MTIKGLSNFSDMCPEVITIACASILGGIAGPYAGLYDARGSVLARPGLNAVMIGLDIPEWFSCQELLLGPVQIAARRLREMSQTVDQDELDKMQSGKPDLFSTRRLVEHLKNSSSYEADDPQNVISGKRAYKVLRQPSFMLNTPTPDTFKAAAEEVLDGVLLAFDADGALFSRLLGRRRDHDWSEFADALANALTGADHVFARPRKYGTAKVRSLDAILFATCGLRHLEMALASDLDPVRRLLQLCWIVDPNQEGCCYSGVDPNHMGWGRQAYRETVNRIYLSRLSGQGLSFELTIARQEQLLAGIQKLQSELNAGIPTELMPFFKRWRSLPYQILWALIALSTNADDFDSSIATALYVSDWLLRGQYDLLRKIIEAERIRREQAARTVMLSKLATNGPCAFRELMRRYSEQRKQLHEPLLRQLIAEGVVRQREGGLLELVQVHPVTSLEIPARPLQKDSQ